MSNLFKFCRLLISGLVLTSSVSVIADERILEEIIVTGTKRAASQQDTPIAISTLTANAIAQTRGNDLSLIHI